MNTLKFTTILIRLAGFYFLTVGLDFLTYLPAQLYYVARSLAPSSQMHYEMELKIHVAKIILYLTLSAACFWFATPIARIFARGLEDDATLISP